MINSYKATKLIDRRLSSEYLPIQEFTLWLSGAFLGFTKGMSLGQSLKLWSKKYANLCSLKQKSLKNTLHDLASYWFIRSSNVSEETLWTVCKLQHKWVLMISISQESSHIWSSPIMVSAHYYSVLLIRRNRLETMLRMRIMTLGRDNWILLRIYKSARALNLSFPIENFFYESRTELACSASSICVQL